MLPFPTLWKLVIGIVTVCEPFKPFCAPNSIIFAARQSPFWIKIMEALIIPAAKGLPIQVKRHLDRSFSLSVFAAMPLSSSELPLLPAKFHVVPKISVQPD